MPMSQHLATGCFTVAWFLSVIAVHADEAVLPQGQRIEGELGSDRDGQLVFRARGQEQPVSLGQLDHVRFSPTPLPPFRAAAPFRVLLHGGEHLTGELLGFSSDKVQLRTAWRDILSIPRAAVAAVRHAPGFVTVFVDDFEKDLKAWRLSGAPVRTTTQHDSGRHSLCFPGPGQAEYIVPGILNAGRAGINFRDLPPTTGLTWQLAAEFENCTGWPSVRVQLDPRSGNYVAEVSGTARGKSSLPRKEGWHRLQMEFNLDTLVISIDDEVLWFCRQPQGGGSLRTVRLSRTASAAGREGEICFDDFSLAQAVSERPHPKSHSDQDELWLLSGDQMFGDVVEEPDHRIRLRTHYGPQAYRWGEVREICFRQFGAAAQKPDGKSVRVWLRSGISYEPDALDGTIQRLDPHRLVLRHAVLGEVEFERTRLHRLRLLR